ncbi:EamA domain-containing membrane protein RarD [Roseibium hamelinense]|uniref:EamA domain-containing membrane protein RarD n=1 Tax=Roseibium hamelinense TaxID=150831 RepID=A0A562TJ35_9HYPH|nr:DMT family transporter [Roseibium hamelinense]MTI42738.1 DMT family transporter [Roseibium hamelinense]TWI93384.1 EamA domain-containing membrane protein RarD [Roseibium hamelinense]
MPPSQTRLLATLTVVTTGAFWGLYWFPVRQLEAAGLQGAWGSAAIVAAATLLTAPFAFARPSALLKADRLALCFVALGGFAFVLYSAAFVYGRVAIIVLLFFLTPVWSTLIGRLVLGWRATRLRIAAIASGLAGLGLMLGAGGQVPMPQGLGEWLGLVSGFLWAVATTGLRVRPKVPAGPASFVFALGALAGVLAFAPFLAPLPDTLRLGALGTAFGIALLAGGLWWGAANAALMWAAPQLEPARTGILLMSEVLIGAVSAAVLAGERLGPLELAGGLLVLTAGILEVWPVKKAPAPLKSEGR